MEKSHKFVLEAFVGILLVVSLIILIFVFTSPVANAKTYSSSTVMSSYNTNSYNTNSYNTNCNTGNCNSGSLNPCNAKLPGQSPMYVCKTQYKSYTHYKTEAPKPTYNKVIAPTKIEPPVKIDNDYLSYNANSDLQTYKGVVGNNVDKYLVNVKNTDCVGGYYKVVFYFRDCYGNEETESVRYYISPNEMKSFSYLDIYGDRYKHCSWNYEVVSETTKPYTTETQPTQTHYTYSSSCSAGCSGNVQPIARVYDYSY